MRIAAVHCEVTAQHLPPSLPFPSLPFPSLPFSSLPLADHSVEN